MKSTIKLKVTTASAVLASVTLTAMALAAAEAESTRGFKFQVGLTYASGINDLADKIEENNPLVKVDAVWPVGLSLHPYYDFGNGLGVGLSVGPATVAFGDATFYIVPIGADVRYAFFRNKPVSPYVRAGFQYPFAGGDFIESSSIGFVGAAGVEFGHSKSISWGVEAGYNSAEVEVLANAGRPAVQVKPLKFTASLFVRF